MRYAGYSLIALAALYLLAVLLSGFAVQGLYLLWYAVLFLLLGLGVTRGADWVSWIAFFAIFVGAAVTVSELSAISPVPAWALAVILLTKLGVAMLLFGIIWRGASRRAVSCARMVPVLMRSSAI